MLRPASTTASTPHPVIRCMARSIALSIPVHPRKRHTRPPHPGALPTPTPSSRPEHHGSIMMRSGETPVLALALAVAVAFLAVIPFGNLLLLLSSPLPSPFLLSFPLGICFFFCLCCCRRLSFCHSLWESASSFVFAVAVAFLAVIPFGNLLLLLSLPLPSPFFLSFPLGICFFVCLCCCRRLSFCHSLWESASSFVFAVAVAFLAVIPFGNLLLLLSLLLPLPFFLSFPLGICFFFVFAVAVAFLSVIPFGNLLLRLSLLLPLPFFLSFPLGICFFFCLCCCRRLSFCHSLWESASSFVFAVAVAFLAVIPFGNLLLRLSLLLPSPFFLSFPFGNLLFLSAFVPTRYRFVPR